MTLLISSDTIPPRWQGLNATPAHYQSKMKRARTVIVAVLLSFLFDVCLAQAPNQNQKEWTWKDGHGRTRTKAELQKIVQKHKNWLIGVVFQDNKCLVIGSKVMQPSLSPATSELINAVVPAANGFSPLSATDLRCANLSGINLSGSTLNGIDLRGAVLRNGILKKINIDGSYLQGTTLENADMEEATLGWGVLGKLDMTEAHLHSAKLKNVAIINVTLDKAEFWGTDLQNVKFESINLPMVRSIASAKHLETMSFFQNPDALTKLRNEFKNAGFRDQERKITYALKTRQAELLYKSWTDNHNWYDLAEYWINKVFFDITCQYGMNPGRVLILILSIIFICSILYTVFPQFSKSSTLAIVVPGAHSEYKPTWLLPYLSGDGKGLQRGGTVSWQQYRIELKPITASSKLAVLWSLGKQEFALFRAALFFSLMSTFNIKFRDIDFGRWLRLLTTTEYDIQAIGWARMVSGLQALVSVYLVALLLLSYFGRPFE